MGRSVISAPILISTTNPKVALAEGVQCRETFGEEHRNHEQTAEARILAEKIMVEQSTPHSRPRRRYVDMLKARIRRKESTFTKIDKDGEITGINRRRAETINLCKDKIKHLTGNGYINRKSTIETSNSNKHAGIERILSHKESRAALLRKTSHAALCLESQYQADNDSHFGSLSRSFNSALEKFDFQTDSVPLLRARSSIFNMRKPEEKQEALPFVTPFVPPNTPRPAFAKLAVNTVADNTTEAVNDNTGTGTVVYSTTANTGKIIASKMTQHAPDPPVNEEVVDDNGKVDGRATQLQFSSDKGYTLAAPRLNYPGGINPLRMHTNVMAMACQKTEKQSREGKAAEGHLQESQSVHSKGWSEVQRAPAHDADIEAAPIYSPSMGELSQYARTSATARTNTPESTPTKPEANKLNKRKSGMGKEHVRKQDENRSPRIKKSKSLAGLFNPFKKDEAPPLPNGTSSLFMPAIPSPLRIVHIAKGDAKKRYGMVGMPTPGEKKG